MAKSNDVPCLEGQGQRAQNIQFSGGENSDAVGICFFCGNTAVIVVEGGKLGPHNRRRRPTGKRAQS